MAGKPENLWQSDLSSPKWIYFVSGFCFSPSLPLTLSVLAQIRPLNHFGFLRLSRRSVPLQPARRSFWKISKPRKEKLVKIYIIYFFRSFYSSFTSSYGGNCRRKKEKLYNSQNKQFAAIFSYFHSRFGQIQLWAFLFFCSSKKHSIFQQFQLRLAQSNKLFRCRRFSFRNIFHGRVAEERIFNEKGK